MKAFALFLFGASVVGSFAGCGQSESAVGYEVTPTASNAANASVDAKAGTVKESAQAVAEDENAAQAEAGILDSVGGLFSDAADMGMDAASDSADYVGDLFQSLKDKGLTTAESTKEWVQEDFQAMGAWEYKVWKMAGSTEDVDKTLNLMGKDRWECFEVNEGVFYFKRPRKSYLRNVPMKDLIKLVPMMQGDN